MQVPNFIIIGETKCGTTSMYDNLIQHPKILPSLGNGEDIIMDGTIPLGVKELRFFDKYYYKGWDWYRNCFPECPEGYITGEASPTYLYREQAIQRIAEVMPDCKLIIMLRNPVDRLISHFNHLKKINYKWQERYPTFGHFWQGAWENDYYLIDKGVYINSIKTLHRYIPVENVGIVSAETMFEHPQVVLDEVTDFLELDKFEGFIPQHSRKGEKTKDHNIYRKEIAEYYCPYNKELEDYYKIDLLWS